MVIYVAGTRVLGPMTEKRVVTFDQFPTYGTFHLLATKISTLREL